MSQFKLHEKIGEVLPWNQKYHYPTQASKAWKAESKILTTRTGGSFGPGERFSITLPAQGYINPHSVRLQFDAELINSQTGANARFQNGIGSIFSRLAWSYGGMPGEDLRAGNILARMVTEGSNAARPFGLDQRSITEGIGGMAFYASADATATAAFDNARTTSIQVARATGTPTAGAATDVGSAKSVRRYEIAPLFGLLLQGKLIPAKWMAPQITFEFTLTSYKDCVCQDLATNGSESFAIRNVALVCEMYDFDGSYDEGFLDGLRSEGGVPIKFSSWNTYIDTPLPAQTQVITIPERYRSIKAAFTVMTARSSNASEAFFNAAPADSHAFLESSTGADSTIITTGHLQSYQYRIGGKMYPNQPVSNDIAGSSGAGQSAGGAEVYNEFARAFNTLGDYRIGLGVNSNRFSRIGSGQGTSSWNDWSLLKKEYVFGPSSFVVAGYFETSDGTEISGLNGEEQNNIALTLNYSSPQSASAQYTTFTYFDALMIIRENNVVEFIK